MRLIVGLNDLATTHPDLIKEWDVDANLPLRPQGLQAGSNKTAYWKCPVCGGKWHTRISHRAVDGTGCPYCSGRKALAGYNDLQSQRPDLAEDWNYEKNSRLTPDQVPVGSGKRVWWKCHICGGEWQTSVANRSNGGTGCPVCANRSVLEGHNDLATTHPQLLEEWDFEANAPLTPQQIQAGSSRKVWWKCSTCGGRWQASVMNRSHGAGCVYCTGIELLRGYNDLETNAPKVAQQWCYEKNGDLRPSDVLFHSGKKVWWKCTQCGYIWRTSISNRTSGQKTGCPACAGREVNPGVNDLQTLFPEVAKDFHPSKNQGLTAGTVASGPSQKVWWKCSVCGGEWQTAVSDRTSHHTGCPYCLGKKALKGFNDVATTHPQICEQWNYSKNGALLPEQFTAGSRKRVWWHCDVCHGDWEATICSRTRESGGICPYCNNLQVLPGFNDLASQHPELLPEIAADKNPGFDPASVTFGSSRKIWWRCPTCGGEWEATIASRANQGEKNTGCPYCSNNKVLPGYNDLTTRYPHLMEEWDWAQNKVNPSQLLPSADIKVWWICKHCGKSWQTTPHSRSAGNNCPLCDPHRSLPEASIEFYLRRDFTVLHSYHTKWLGRKELDLFLPDYQIAIEYDGQAWHEDLSRDLDKNILCTEHGITLIRVREPECPPIPEAPSVSCSVISAAWSSYEDSHNHYYMVRTLEALRQLLMQYTGIPLSPYDVDIPRDMDEIQDLQHS